MKKLFIELIVPTAKQGLVPSVGSIGTHRPNSTLTVGYGGNFITRLFIPYMRFSAGNANGRSRLSNVQWQFKCSKLDTGKRVLQPDLYASTSFLLEGLLRCM